MPCRVQPHPEDPSGALTNSASLPFAEEAGHIKQEQYRDRMRAASAMHLENEDEGLDWDGPGKTAAEQAAREVGLEIGA